MRKFKFVIINSRGKKERVLIQAEDATSAKNKLGKARVYSFREVKFSKASGKRLLGDHATFLIAIANKLSFLINSGVDITKSLEITIRGCASKKHYRVLLEDVKYSVDKGNKLSDSFEGASTIFPPFFVGMIRVGEESGGLGESFKAIADYYEKNMKLKESVRKVAIMPIITVVGVIVVALILFRFVFPGFFASFEGMGAELPESTKPLLAVSGIIEKHFVLIIVGIVLFFASLIALYNLPPVKERIQKFAVKLPLVGSYILAYNLAAIASTLSNLNRRGVKLYNSFQLLIGITKNLYIKKCLKKVLALVESGVSLSASFESLKVFEDEFISVLEVGENIGDVSGILSKIATQYDTYLEVRSSKMITSVTIMATVAAGILVGLLAWAVYFPMLEVSQSLLDSM